MVLGLVVVRRSQRRIEIIKVFFNYTFESVRCNRDDWYASSTVNEGINNM